MCLFVDIVEHHIEEELREVRLFIDVQMCIRDRVMKASKGQANPAMTNKLIQEELKKR